MAIWLGVRQANRKARELTQRLQASVPPQEGLPQTKLIRNFLWRAARPTSAVAVQTEELRTTATTRPQLYLRCTIAKSAVSAPKSLAEIRRLLISFSFAAFGAK